jgi:hypothetical protein
VVDKLPGAPQRMRALLVLPLLLAAATARTPRNCGLACNSVKKCLVGHTLHCTALHCTTHWLRADTGLVL